MKIVNTVLCSLLLALMLTLPVAAADPPSEVTLFKNVNIFGSSPI